MKNFFVALQKQTNAFFQSSTFVRNMLHSYWKFSSKILKYGELALPFHSYVSFDQLPKSLILKIELLSGLLKHVYL